jgi:hypothetical protein
MDESWKLCCLDCVLLLTELFLRQGRHGFLTRREETGPGRKRKRKLRSVRFQTTADVTARLRGCHSRIGKLLGNKHKQVSVGPRISCLRGRSTNPVLP